jgi:2',3'-cyclic-nucleotide 2'-phosphodiesterase (5'-nucleotidase family)
MIHIQKTRDERYNQFIAKAMNRMGYDAVTVGQIELERGVDYVREYMTQFEAKVVVSNVRATGGDMPWAETEVITVGKKRIGLLGLVSADFGRGTEILTDLGWEIDDPFATSERLVAELRDRCDIVVALAHLEKKELTRYLNEAVGVDLVVAGWNPTQLSGQQAGMITSVLRPGMRGEFVGVARVGPEGSGEEGGRAFDLESIMLKIATIGEDPELADQLAELKTEIEADRRKAQLEREIQDSEGPVLGQDRFLGTESCVRCHKDVVEWWEAEPHSRALATLAAKKRDQDESCLPCHVTGFGEPGGYRSVGTTSDMSNVQCESCHGMGTLHDWTGGTMVAPGEETCRTCHDSEWSPDFNYKTYLKRLGHGGKALD